MEKRRVPSPKREDGARGLGFRQMSAQRGQEVLSEKLPLISRLTKDKANTASERIVEFKNKKTYEKNYQIIRGNVSNVENLVQLAENQNSLLRQIIEAVGKEDDGQSDGGIRRPGRRGSRRTARQAARREAARRRLARMQASRNERARTGRAAAPPRTQPATRVQRPSLETPGRRSIPRPIEAAMPRSPTAQPRPIVETPRPTIESPRPATAQPRPTVEAPRPIAETPRPTATPVTRQPVTPAAPRENLRARIRSSIPSAAKRVASSVAKKIIPGAAIALAALPILDRLRVGDLTGAGVELGAAVIGSIPLIGPVAGLAAAVTNEARDLYRELLDVYPEEDSDNPEREDILKEIISQLATYINEAAEEQAREARERVAIREAGERAGAAAEFYADQPAPSQLGVQADEETAAERVVREAQQQQERRVDSASQEAAEISRLWPEIQEATKDVSDRELLRGLPRELSGTARRAQRELWLRRKRYQLYRERSQADSSLATPASFEDMSDITDVSYDAEQVSAEPIVRTMGEDEDMQSALPYPENLIEMLSRTEFNEIEIDADKIIFDGEIKVSSVAREPSSTGQGEIEGGGGGGTTIQRDTASSISPPSVQAASSTQATPYAASAASAATSFGGGAGTSLATPAALPSPAATAVPRAPSAGNAPQQGEQGGQQSGDFMSEVNRVSSRLGINPANLLAVMKSESSLNPQAVNRSTGASGLIQFMPRTAQSLGTSVEAIRQMSASQQMPYVEKFFQSVRLPSGSSAGRLYAYVFLPGRANREILTQRGENYYEANRGLDVNQDGQITIADLDARLARYGAVGGATMQAAAPGTGGALAAAGAGMAAADQAQLRSGGSAMIVQTGGQQSTPAAAVSAVSQTREVPLNIRLQKQVA